MGKKEGIPSAEGMPFGLGPQGCDYFRAMPLFQALPTLSAMV